MDEYIGLPRDSQESYHTFMWNHLFSKIDIEPRNVNILDGNAADLEGECIAYEEKIKAVGGIDLFLSGIGEDGHIAFNEPGSSLVSRTRVKTLAYDTILANARFFDGDVNKVPKMALTVGVQTILEAHEVVVIVLGAKKALALQRTIEHGVNHMWTLSALQLHRHPMIVVDDDATLELQIKTVKYFKSIEKVAREQGFDQVLPAKARNGIRLVDKPSTNGNGIVSGRHATDPAPVTSGLAAPVSEYPLRSISPDFTPDRMKDRIVRLNGL